MPTTAYASSITTARLVAEVVLKAGTGGLLRLLLLRHGAVARPSSSRGPAADNLNDKRGGSLPDLRRRRTRPPDHRRRYHRAMTRRCPPAPAPSPSWRCSVYCSGGWRWRHYLCRWARCRSEMTTMAEDCAEMGMPKAQDNPAIVPKAPQSSYRRHRCIASCRSRRLAVPSALTLRALRLRATRLPESPTPGRCADVRAIGSATASTAFTACWLAIPSDAANLRRCQYAARANTVRPLRGGVETRACLFLVPECTGTLRWSRSCLWPSGPRRS